MSIKCQSWVYEHSEATGNDRLVLLAIADEADDDGTNAYPGIERIAHKARVNKRTTMRCLERLEADGLLEVQRPDTKGRGHHNTYVVLMGQPEKGDTLSRGPSDPEGARNGDRKARKGAQGYLDCSRPIDPLTQDPEVKDSRADPFEQFWQAYPNARGKGQARTAWENAAKKTPAQTILAAAVRFANDPNLPEPQFIPYASTWLNGERWSDAPLPPRSRGKAPTRPTHSGMTDADRDLETREMRPDEY